MFRQIHFFLLISYLFSSTCCSLADEQIINFKYTDILLSKFSKYFVNNLEDKLDKYHYQKLLSQELSTQIFHSNLIFYNSDDYQKAFFIIYNIKGIKIPLRKIIKYSSGYLVHLKDDHNLISGIYFKNISLEETNFLIKILNKIWAKKEDRSKKFSLKSYILNDLYAAEEMYCSPEKSFFSEVLWKLSGTGKTIGIGILNCLKNLPRQVSDALYLRASKYWKHITGILRVPAYIKKHGVVGSVVSFWEDTVSKPYRNLSEFITSLPVYYQHNVKVFKSDPKLFVQLVCQILSYAMANIYVSYLTSGYDLQNILLGVNYLLNVYTSLPPNLFEISIDIIKNFHVGGISYLLNKLIESYTEAGLSEGGLQVTLVFLNSLAKNSVDIVRGSKPFLMLADFYKACLGGNRKLVSYFRKTQLLKGGESMFYADPLEDGVKNGLNKTLNNVKGACREMTNFMKNNPEYKYDELQEQLRALDKLKKD